MESIPFWDSIKDLPDNWINLKSPTLELLSSAWKERAQQIEGSKDLERFKIGLREEWLSDVDMMEYLYSSDRGTTQTLIEQGLQLSLPLQNPEIRLAELSVPSTIEGLFSFVTQDRPLSSFYLRELHQVLTRNQLETTAIDSQGNQVVIPLEHGRWKTRPNNPCREDGTIHYYCPPEQVESEIERLIMLHHEHVELEVPPEIEAAWLHHRFTQIHPFQDGNGRVARMIASLIFLRAGLFPLVIKKHSYPKRSDYEEYILAAEAADQGNLSKLINLFGRLQQGILMKGLSLGSQINWRS